MAKPTVTVLMTVRNGEPYLREAVASILNQTYRDFRFLILDNASTDSSRDTIKSFADPRIELVELAEDMGQTAALNCGLHMIDTPLVARMDADDVSMPERLAKQVAHMEQNPGIALLGTWCQLVDTNGTHLGTFHPPITQREILDGFSTQSPFAHPSVMFQSASVNQAGGYPADYANLQDFALWFEMSCRFDVANLPHELMQLRIHPEQTNLSPDRRTKNKWDELRVYRRAYTRMELSPHARKIAKRKAAFATMAYAEALSQNGHMVKAVRWAGAACVSYPVLLLRDRGMKARVARLLLGTRAWGSVRAMLRILFRQTRTTGDL